MRVAIVGSRNCSVTFDEITKVLPQDCDTIVSGGAEGIDQVAKEYAQYYGLDYVEYLPEYSLYGKRAPLIRNQDIVHASDMVLAFWDYHSPGTRDTLLYALKQKKKIQIIIVEKKNSVKWSMDKKTKE